MRKIMFTGGGSAGHVTVNIALIPRLLHDRWSVVYVGSKEGIEKDIVTRNKIRYIGISSGKLRRYFDVKNFTDPMRVLKGMFEAYRIVRKEKPDVLFSKGGFVSVPVVIGAWLNKVPVVIHESDITPGLANRIAMRFADAICTTFKESEDFLPAGRTHVVGAVVREDLNKGDRQKGKAFCQFDIDKPVLMIVGGSLGAKKINRTVRDALSTLTERYNVVHLCGKGNRDGSITSPHYRQYEYLNEELPHLLAATDVVVSRAGSNSIFELLHLRKPMLLIPLTKEQSRGDQILNAQSFERSGFCKVLYEEQLTEGRLVAEINDVYDNRSTFIRKMKDAERQDALSRVIEIIKKVAEH